MQKFFEQSQQLVTEELSWLTAQFEQAFSKAASDGRSFFDANRASFDKLIEEQTAAVTQWQNHYRALVERQAQLYKEAISSK